MDHFQGREDENAIYPSIRRPDFQTNESGQVSRNNEAEELLPNLLEIINGEPGKEKE